MFEAGNHTIYVASQNLSLNFILIGLRLVMLPGTLEKQMQILLQEATLNPDLKEFPQGKFQ